MNRDWQLGETDLHWKETLSLELTWSMLTVHSSTVFSRVLGDLKAKRRLLTDTWQGCNKSTFNINPCHPGWRIRIYLAIVVCLIIIIKLGALLNGWKEWRAKVVVSKGRPGDKIRNVFLEWRVSPGEVDSPERETVLWGLQAHLLPHLGQQVDDFPCGLHVLAWDGVLHLDLLPGSNLLSQLAWILKSLDFYSVGYYFL